MDQSAPLTAGAGRDLAAGADRRARTVSSVLWAAWADSLGFISELTSPDGLRRRLRGDEFTDPVAWTRRIGGKFGPSLDLPAGCYSDDTQLRLSTSRAISVHGFDVEAFARIELPMWQAYALGGGRASRAAALGFTKARVAWFANFYKGWQDSGGNGVAMRIQPHVWASQDLSGTDHVRDTIVNGVTSHGHPRALVGAVLHAQALACALRERRTPQPRDYPALLEATRIAARTFDRHPDLSTIWKPEWERTTGSSLDATWDTTVSECDELLFSCRNLGQELADTADGAAGQTVYQRIVDQLNLTDTRYVGSGTATVVAALLLAAARPDDPAAAARLASRALGTDTDTIATMAAALVGAGSAAASPEVLDHRYLHEEANRLADLALGEKTTLFRYPDLLHWTPPISALDCVGLIDDQIALAGISVLTRAGETTRTKDADWQWMTTAFGASLLIKRRPNLRPLPPGNRPAPTAAHNPGSTGVAAPTADTRGTDDPFLPVFGNPEQVPFAIATGRTKDRPAAAAPAHLDGRQPFGGQPDSSGQAKPIDVDTVLAWTVKSGLTDQAVGYAIKQVAQRGTVEQLVALSMAIRAAGARRS